VVSHGNRRSSEFQNLNEQSDEVKQTKDNSRRDHPNPRVISSTNDLWAHGVDVKSRRRNVLARIWLNRVLAEKLLTSFDRGSSTRSGLTGLQCLNWEYYIHRSYGNVAQCRGSLDIADEATKVNGLVGSLYLLTLQWQRIDAVKERN
jgi:hypothetical protein